MMNHLLNLNLGPKSNLKISLCDNPANPYKSEPGQEAYLYQFRLGSIVKSVWITPYGVFLLG